jgi:hypothetical protein
MPAVPAVPESIKESGTFAVSPEYVHPPHAGTPYNPFVRPMYEEVQPEERAREINLPGVIDAQLCELFKICQPKRPVPLREPGVYPDAIDVPAEEIPECAEFEFDMMGLVDRIPADYEGVQAPEFDMMALVNKMPSNYESVKVPEYAAFEIDMMALVNNNLDKGLESFSKGSAGALPPVAKPDGNIEVPEVPDVPEILAPEITFPEIPAPDVPSIPDVPCIPDIVDIPSIPSIPEVPVAVPIPSIPGDSIIEGSHGSNDLDSLEN